jgi:pyruvate dehydrogenase kinase 2/3/4
MPTAATSTDIALNTLDPHPDYVGIICKNAVRRSLLPSWRAGRQVLTAREPCFARSSQNVHEICTEAIENAKFVCGDHYALFKVPDVHLVCDPNLTFPFVPGHLCGRRSCRSFRTIPDSLLTSALRSQGPHHL